MFRVVGKRALFQGKGALFGVVHTKNHGHYFEVALFGVTLFEVLLYRTLDQKKPMIYTLE